MDFGLNPHKLNTLVKMGYIIYFSYSKIFFVFGFLFMAHSLHVQMDFFIYGNVFLGLIRN